MGEIYFKKREFQKARKLYFNMVNMDPANKETHRALNRIGDLYLIQGRGNGSALSLRPIGQA